MNKLQKFTIRNKYYAFAVFFVCFEILLGSILGILGGLWPNASVVGLFRDNPILTILASAVLSFILIQILSPNKDNP